jgi:hypothetical protein
MPKRNGRRADAASADSWLMPAVGLMAIGVFSVVSLSFLAETLLARYPAWARGGLFG